MSGQQNSNDKIKRLKQLDKESQLLTHAIAILHWDQETFMPESAIDERSEQLALMQAEAHKRATTPEIAELLEAMGSTTDNPSGDPSLSEWERAFLREKYREYRLATKLPTEFVAKFTEVTSKGQAAWAKARAANDFAAFKPHLETTVSMARKMADYLGYEDHPYDALLDQYEPYMTAAEVKRIFAELEAGLVPIVKKIGASKQVDASFMHEEYPADQQEAFSHEVLKGLNYPTERGRLDRSAHPFTTTLGSNDVRITTRFDEHFLPSAVFSTIHEFGHAMYELGVDSRHHGTLLGEGTSLGIHESQSRMWENIVGRSRSFWDYWLPRLKDKFPSQLGDVSNDAFYRAINRVEPSLIRVEADEVTYSLHVIIRFRLELQLLEGSLSVSDLPQAWNGLYKELLGVEPDSDRTGVLQDVHWSAGLIGYFPTYALGNLYAAKFWNVIERDIPNVWDQVKTGDTSTILKWLREKIHVHGKAKSASELVVATTGEPLDSRAFISYLERKYSDVYGF